MYYTIEKFQKRVLELGQRRYRKICDMTPFVSMEGQLSQDEWYAGLPEKIEGPSFGLNDFFVGRDRYLYLKKDVTVPSHKDGFEVVGLFNFGETGGGGNSGFESLLYVNRAPLQGVDTNHHEVLLGEYEGQDLDLTFLLWTGLEGGGAPRTFYHQCKQAEFAYLHKKTDALYFFGRAVTETLLYLEKTDENYEDLVALFDRVLLQIDWDDDSFYSSADLAYEVLMQGLKTLEKNTKVTAYGIGHTHIDVAWLWRLKHTREKAQRSFATVLRLMDRYHEYVFLQTQPQLYQYIKQDCPELYKKIKQKIAEGKWEVDGGMWVEADCNVVSGESLVRQLLHGTRFIEREFGKKCHYLWLPDVFGYSWALPQILRLCELDTFMTTKISWNQYNTIPDDLFWWRGIDGSEILTYFVDTPGPNDTFTSRFSSYNGLMEPRAVIGAWSKFKNKELSKEYLISYGYGDGGGGVNRDMLEMRRAMDEIPGCPHVKTDTAEHFFQRMHECVDNTSRPVHTWDGELYLEYHRGTYTTQGYNKRMNRVLENKLTQIEWLNSLAYVHGSDYAQQTLHDCWECLLLHQFHDIIPGSSIREVYADSKVNYAKAELAAEQVRTGAMARLVDGEENVYTVYSTNSFSVSEAVLIPENREGAFYAEDGVLLDSQKTGDGYWVQVQTVPFGAVPLSFRPTPVTQGDSSFSFNGQTLYTPFYRICWNEGGQLCEIYDKQAARQVLRDGALGNALEIYEDKPIKYDAWDIDIFHGEKYRTISAISAPALVEDGALRMVIHSSYRIHNSTIEQNMIVYRDSRRIDFVTEVDWHEDHRLLKTAFYTDIRSTKATYDIQFGHVERPTHWNNSWDWAKFEVCGHKWADLSETNYGVSLLNNCKYGHSIKENAMKLTLLKSPKHPDVQADMGTHSFTYSLYPHVGSVTVGGTIEQANALNLPAQVVVGKWVDARRLVHIDSDEVQLDVIKKAEEEDCLIVRLHECRGGSHWVRLASDFDLKRITPCNLIEHDLAEPIDSSSIDFMIKPFEIKSFKLFF